MPDDAFADLVRKARGGDPRAAEVLVREYEPAIRREVRLMTTSTKRHIVETVDVCQSVMKSFFIRIAAGQFDVSEPGQLFALLKKMARNKVRERLRKRREDRMPDYEPYSTENDPAWPIVAKDLLENVERRLDSDERLLWQRRREGRSWDEIAAEVGKRPDALKKRYSRAIDRVSQELGLEGLV